jgi:hypothetical protein
VNSALDFFGDSATAPAASGSASRLGKRKREERTAGSDGDCESGGGVEEERTATGGGNETGVCGAAVTLLTGHTSVESDKPGRKKKRKKLSKETKQLLHRQDVMAASDEFSKCYNMPFQS